MIKNSIEVDGTVDNFANPETRYKKNRARPRLKRLNNGLQSSDEGLTRSLPSITTSDHSTPSDSASSRFFRPWTLSRGSSFPECILFSRQFSKSAPWLSSKPPSQPSSLSTPANVSLNQPPPTTLEQPKQMPSSETLDVRLDELTPHEEVESYFSHAVIEHEMGKILPETVSTGLLTVRRMKTIAETSKNSESDTDDEKQILDAEGGLSGVSNEETRDVRKWRFQAFDQELEIRLKKWNSNSGRNTRRSKTSTSSYLDRFARKVQNLRWRNAKQHDCSSSCIGFHNNHRILPKLQHRIKAIPSLIPDLFRRSKSPQSLPDPTNITSSADSLVPVSPVLESVPEDEYTGSDNKKYVRVEISQRGAPAFLPSEAVRVGDPAGTPKLVQSGGLYVKRQPTFVYSSSVPSKLKSSWSRTDKDAVLGPERDWFRMPMEDMETDALDHDLPEHLPNSPLCPKHPKNPSKGKGICVYHGRNHTSLDKVDASNRIFVSY